MPAARSMTALRNGDPETSHEAAASVQNVSLTQNRILTILGDFESATDETIKVEYLRRFSPVVSDSGLRSRRAELVDMKKVVATPQKGKTASGRSTTRWAKV